MDCNFYCLKCTVLCLEIILGVVILPLSLDFYIIIVYYINRSPVLAFPKFGCSKVGHFLCNVSIAIALLSSGKISLDPQEYSAL